MNTVLASNRLNEFRAQFGREDRPREANTDNLTLTVTGLGTTGRVSFLPSLETDDRYQVVDNLMWLFGPHSLRTGVDFNFTRTMQPFFLSRSAGEYSLQHRERLSQHHFHRAAAVARLPSGLRPRRRGLLAAGVRVLTCRTRGKRAPSLTVNYGLRYEAQIKPPPDHRIPRWPVAIRFRPM